MGKVVVIAGEGSVFRRCGWTDSVRWHRLYAAYHLIALDRTTVAALAGHRNRQRAGAADCGPGYRDSGYVFTGLNGDPMAPDRLTRTFTKLTALAGLPPVRLHGLRHGAASLAQMGRIASDASFRGSCERALPASQRAAVRCRRRARRPRGCGDLGLHGPPGSDATMMRLMPLRWVHHRRPRVSGGGRRCSCEGTRWTSGSSATSYA